MPTGTLILAEPTARLNEAALPLRVDHHTTWAAGSRSPALTSIDDTLAEIGEVEQSDWIPELLVRLAGAHGMKTVAYLGTGTLDRRLPRREPYLAVTYSTEWIERYRSRGYVKIDPVIQIGLRRLLPIDWDDLLSRCP